MQKRELNNIEDLKRVLINKGYTEHAPLQIEPKLTICYSLNQPEIGAIIGKIEAKYLYVKEDILFVANSEFDEVAVDCIESQCLNSLLSTPIGHKY